MTAMTTESRLSEEAKVKIKTLVREIVGDSPDAIYVEEMVETVLRLGREKTDRGDLKLVNSSLKEMRYAFNVFARYKDVPKVTVFGSARTSHTAPAYKMAKNFAHKLAQHGFMIITGAAGGIMRACNEGAGKGKSFGVNIRLPFEQKANEFVDEDKLINFKYFFTRKLMFVKESDAIALFPGGFGTMDEGFELFTLVQTGKSTPRPIVLVDVPGGTYWKNWEKYILENLHKAELISPSDLHLFFVTEDVDAAVREITKFYRVYHSCRYVGKDLVLRLKRDISDAALGKLNKEFKDILVKGEIRRTPPLPEEVEDNDQLDWFRLLVPFNQRDYGRLRLLIDRINTSA